MGALRGDTGAVRGPHRRSPRALLALCLILPGACGRLGYAPLGGTPDAGDPAAQDAPAGNLTDADLPPSTIGLLPDLAQAATCAGTTTQLTLGRDLPAGAVVWVSIGQRMPADTSVLSIGDAAGHVYEQHASADQMAPFRLEL
jgi:hypothetical protein